LPNLAVPAHRPADIFITKYEWEEPKEIQKTLGFIPVLFGKHRKNIAAV
jgi:hypothetical protein